MLKPFKAHGQHEIYSYTLKVHSYVLAAFVDLFYYLTSHFNLVAFNETGSVPVSYLCLRKWPNLQLMTVNL